MHNLIGAGDFINVCSILVHPTDTIDAGHLILTNSLWFQYFCDLFADALHFFSLGLVAGSVGLSYELKGLKWTNTSMLIFAVCPKCHATKGNTNSINEGDLNENLKSELKFQKVVHLIWYLAGVISVVQ